MTSPMFGAVPPVVHNSVKRMREDAFDRDITMARVRMVRDGRFADVWPDQFSEKYPTALVANFVDVAARDLASNLAPLPSLSCSAGSMRTDADKRRAEKKNRIGANYWKHCALEFQMKYGADQYLSYGFLPFWVEADYKNRLPYIHVEDPQGAYYELDRHLKCRRYARVWRQDTQELAAQWPEYANLILFDKNGREHSAQDTEVVRYIDGREVLIYLPERGCQIVARYDHGLDFCPVHIALRPGLHYDPRGQFDDVLWVQLAHAVMAALTIEAGHKSVQAPLAVPSDVNEIAIGPDNVIVTDNPDKVQRVPLQVPAAAFNLGESLKEEMKEGVGYPESRLGSPSASNITGRGISALEGGFDSQIKLGQDVIGLALREITAMAFKMDVALWPSRAKTISGTLSGESFEVTYIPKRDISDKYAVEVSYGFASGVSPNGAIVTLLQLRGDEIIGRDTFRRQLPFDVDVDQQQRELDVQAVEDALKQGLAAAIQASGQMIAQGQTAEALQFFTAASQVIKGRRDGKELSDLILEVFQQSADAAAAQQAQQQGAPGGPGGPGGGDPLDGVGPNGLPQGVAPGQAGMPPGGRPSVTDLSAGFTGNGAPSVGALVRRRVPTG